MTLSLLERLDHMRITASNAADAERLLRHLCVFRDAFAQVGLIAMTPMDMSTEQRVAAFWTLRRRRIVDKISRRRYRIDDSLKQQFMPSNEMCEQYFTTVLAQISLYDRSRNFFYWADFCTALL